MSTGLNCEIIEPVPDNWYYVLEDCMAPKCAWDWREYAEATGPFPTKAECVDYLSAHEANPGGWNTVPFERWKNTHVYAELLRKARAPKRKERWRL